VEADKIRESMRVDLPRFDMPAAPAESESAPRTTEPAPPLATEVPSEPEAISVSRDPGPPSLDPK